MPKGKHDNHVKSVEHGRWNHGVIMGSNGYRKVRVGAGHPLADPNGYAYEHHLVWVGAGNPSPLPGYVLHHRNGCKTDNRIENLEMVDRQTHEINHGRLKLRDEDVVEIRKRYASGEKQKDIANVFGVPHQRISKIVRGKSRIKAGGPISCRGDHRKRGDDGKFL